MPPSSPLPPAPLPRRLPSAVPPPRRYNRTGLYLAIFLAMACVPFTLKFQLKHQPDMKNRRWQMLNLFGTTSTEAIKRFGKPLKTRDFSLSGGNIFAGPKVGLKHFYLPSAPDYAERMKDPVVWEFPQYAMIREVIWKLPDSYLTMWFHEPRAIIDLSGDDSQVLLPSTADGEWIALDNYRIGNDFIKTQPAL